MVGDYNLRAYLTLETLRDFLTSCPSFYMTVVTYYHDHEHLRKWVKTHLFDCQHCACWWPSIVDAGTRIPNLGHRVYSRSSLGGYVLYTGALLRVWFVATNALFIFRHTATVTLKIHPVTPSHLTKWTQMYWRYRSRPGEFGKVSSDKTFNHSVAYPLQLQTRMVRYTDDEFWMIRNSTPITTCPFM